jgi:uroporphyrinogen-III synthase
VAAPLDEEARAAVDGADYVTFTSASSVRNVLDAGATLRGPRLVSIGPVTSAVLHEHDLAPHVEATEHTPDGLIEALLADVAGA